MKINFNTLPNIALKQNQKIYLNMSCLYKTEICTEEVSGVNFCGNTIQKEKDEIIMLLLYSLLNKYWQNNSLGNSRGFNIGAILVNSNNEIVNIALNTVNKSKDATKHAEMNVIQTYFKNHPEVNGDLKNYTIYTSLEPCTMCSGAILQTNVKRVVYGMNDEEYGGVFARLISKDNSKYLFYTTKHGYFKFQHAQDEISKKMRALFRKNGYKSQNNIEWLQTQQVKNLFKESRNKLLKFKLKNIENKNILDSAQQYLKNTNFETCI